MSDVVDVSVILPCYRAGELVRGSVALLEECLRPGPWSYEIIVVDDGGGDVTAADLAESPFARTVRLPVNQGKGAAVRAGLMAARGTARVFTDIDVPYDPDLILVMASHLRQGYHLVVGDRTLPGSQYAHDIGWRRRLASNAFSFLVGHLVTGGFYDTQCGLKALRGDVAQLLAPLLRINRFAFDVELLYVALKHRLDIKRVPVRLRRNETSSVRLIRDSSRMLVDVGRLKINQVRGSYDCQPLAMLLSAEHERHRAAVRQLLQERPENAGSAAM
ncbi:MAG TPA: glycosyltransferase [Gemmatimonadaceae bacterium]|nr:glycosyltransferase [Gemmatimonadaceae bacterium]